MNLLKGYGESLKARRTINFFKPEIVPQELLLEAIEIARWAPNHKLTEPWHFYLLGKDTVEKVSKLIVELKVSDRDKTAEAAIIKRLQGVPSWFIVTCKVSTDSLQQQEDYAACACAVQNMSLYLWQAGVGMKWTTGEVTRDQRLYEILRIDSQQKKVIGLFWCGYPAQATPKQKRKAVAEISSSLP